MSMKNRLFAKYGHKCEITYTGDELPMFLSSNSCFERFKRKLVRMSMVSEVNRRATYYLKSQGTIAEEHRRHLKYIYMIHPFSDSRIIWEVIMVFVYFQQFASIPFDLIRNKLYRIPQFTPTLGWKWYRNLLDAFCLVDVFMNFFTGHYDHSNRQVVLDPKEVAIYYLKTYFVIDLVSSIPTYIDLFYPFHIDHLHMYIMICLYLKHLKYSRLLTFRDLTFHCAQNFNFSFIAYRIIMTIVLFVLYFHLCCCIVLYTLGTILDADEDGIYQINSDNEKIIVSRGYINALYQTTIIVCTAGYGNLIMNYTVKIVVMVIWLVSKIFYIYLLARIMEVVMAKTSSSHKYVEMVRQLKEYMRHKQLPEYMQKRLLNYYEFRFQKSYFRENEILNTISGQLRQEIIMHSCRKLVENVGFFKNLPITLLVRIVSCLKSEIFLVNDVIVKANTTGDCMYFISTGTVAVYTKSGREICHLEDGSHFGEIALVMRDQLRIASVIAVEICELYRLDRRDFVRAIYPYPDLLNNIQHIAADRMERTGILDEHNRREMATKRL